uniref:Calx-beta domain-containing protein n=1 Tax=Noctiluca scintillans TaxID=2966 RepID=A0A7S1A0G7_NOCSC
MADLIIMTTIAPEETPAICEPGGKGMIFPLGGESEQNLPHRLKQLLYGFGLLYCFVGVSIVADLFMSAIERITSKKRRVRVPGTNRFVTTQVWNGTVANLTLMALGSSAPEIMLAINDVIKNEFYDGELGPSTIVGSAAFNLFVIIAVCINAVPDGETRKIKEVGVYKITAVFSVFAYIWLLFIVQLHSKDVIDVWEGVLTFLFFPLLVGIAWAADAGWFSQNKPNFSVVFLDRMSTKDFGPQNEDVEKQKHRGIGQLAALSRMGRRRSDEEVDVVDITPEATMKRADSVLRDDEGQVLVNDAGIFCFASDIITVSGGTEEHKYTIVVLRKNGSDGIVSCKYRMEKLTATPGYDYEDEEGSLNFKYGDTTAEFDVTILPKQVGERTDQFQIILEDSEGGAGFNPSDDGGEESCILTVTILNDNPGQQSYRSKIYNCLDRVVNLDEFFLGKDLWIEGVREVWYCNGSPEEQATARYWDWFLHISFFPWKLVYAVLTPPPVFLGGWICFVVSLFHIACLTIVISDLAESFGCVAGLKASITAITIVALGTSVPDLFASKTAAAEEPYADASIVNVTGSNSVNVFLGIGLPWMMAAIYWEVNGADTMWYQTNAKYAEAYPNGAFIVKSGDLAFSVVVFTVGALVCLMVIGLRRFYYGGELGGPPDAKACSSALLVLLWLFYIFLSVWKAESGNDDLLMQGAMIVGSVPIMVVLLLLFVVMMRILKFSKRFIGEEGFWGVLVATSVLLLRFLVFLYLQFDIF